MRILDTPEEVVSNIVGKLQERLNRGDKISQIVVCVRTATDDPRSAYYGGFGGSNVSTRDALFLMKMAEERLVRMTYDNGKESAFPKEHKGT